MIFTVHLCVRGGFFVQVCTLCKRKPADALLFFHLQVWVYTECATWRQQGHSFVSLINIDTVCILCVGVQQRRTRACLSLCDWLHWDFVQTELRFFVSLALGVCECARMSVRVWLQCARVRFLWRSLNVCVVWMHGCSIQTVLFALPVPALDGGSSVSLACLM